MPRRSASIPERPHANASARPRRRCARTISSSADSFSPAGPAQADHVTRPITLLATAIPPSATLNVAIHTLHVLPEGTRGALPGELVSTAERNAADALHRCHHALELDGADHGYDVDEWLPTVYDIAGPSLQSARLGTERPTLVQEAQEAISWLSRAVAELDESSEEAPSSIVETLARLLTVWTFTDAALRHRPSA